MGPCLKGFGLIIAQAASQAQVRLWGGQLAVPCQAGSGLVRNNQKSS
jgi:hypothetical protein